MTDLDDELARHHGAAFGWALTCCKWDRSAAEDVLQAAYLKVVDGSARFEGRSEFRTFLFGVIRRTAIGERRRRAIRAMLPLASLREGTSAGARIDPEGLGRLLRAERSTQLIAALKQLSDRQREVLHLVFYQDMSIADAANVLGVAIGTARTHYERGKAQLRQLLDNE